MTDLAALAADLVVGALRNHERASGWAYTERDRQRLDVARETPSFGIVCRCGWRVTAGALSIVEAGYDRHRAERAVAVLRIEHQLDAWVHTGERMYVEGIPFGGWEETGEAYHSSGGCLREGDAPLYRIRALEQS